MHSTWCFTASWASEWRHVLGVFDEVGHDHDQAPSPRDLAGTIEALGEAELRPTVGAGCGIDSRQDRHEMVATLAGRDGGAPLAVGDHGADAVAAPRGQHADAGAGREHHVALLLLRGAEVEAGAAVDDQPALELAIGDGFAEVGDAGAGRDVPVDVPDVVAGLVDPGLTGLGAVARHQAAMVAVQDAVEPAGDVDLESTQHAGGPRRDGGGRRRVGCGCAGHDATGHADRRLASVPGASGEGYQGSAGACWCAAHVSVPWLGVTRGAGTVESTRARIVSESTSWASAS